MENKKKFPIPIGTAVLMRDYGGTWFPCFLAALAFNEDDDEPFRSFEAWHNQITPWAGNTEYIGTMDSPADLWDYKKLKEENYIDGITQTDLLYIGSDDRL